MAGWLGSNFTAQLDQIKKGVSQVSTIVKDTLVVDETWDQEQEVGVGGDDGEEENFVGDHQQPPSRENELIKECKQLQKLYKAAVEEKESQCKTFRELLLEKENEIQEMGCLLGQSSEGSEVITDMKHKLFKVLEAVGQEVSEEETYDELLGRINKLNIITNGATEESNKVADNDFLEKEKLLKVTKKLKDECMLLREKLADTEARLQTVDKSPNDSLSNSMYSKVEEEFNQMKISYDSLMKEKEDCFAELNEAKDKLESQEAEMKLLKDQTNAVQTDQEQKLEEVLNRNVQLKKSLEETDCKFKTQEAEIESLKRDIATLTSSLDSVTQQNESLKCDLVSNSENKDEKLMKLEEQSSLLQNEVDCCKNEISNLLHQIEKQEAENERINREAVESKYQLELEEAKVSELESKLQSNNSLLQDLQLKIEQKDEEIALMKVSSEKLQRTIDEKNFDSSVDAANDELIKIKKQFSEVSHEKEVIRTELETSTNKYKAAEAQLEQYSGSIESLKSELNKSFALNEQLSSQLSSSSTHVEENKSLQVKLEQSDQKCQDLKVQIAALETSKKESCLLNEKTSNDFENLKVELASAHQQLVNLEGTHNENYQLLEQKLEQSLMINSELETKLEEAELRHGNELMEMQNKLDSSLTQIEMFSDSEEKHKDSESRNFLLSKELESVRLANQDLNAEIFNLKQENEDLGLKTSELKSENETMMKTNDASVSDLKLMKEKLGKSEMEIESLKTSLNSSSENVKSLEQQVVNLEDKMRESSNLINDQVEKEKNYIEALDSLKSINEMITKTARDNEARKIDLEENNRQLQIEIDALRNSFQDTGVKNVELSSQMDLLMARKLELETELIEARKSIQVLEADLRNVAHSKENRVTEEKDVDEAEQEIDNNMVHVLNEKIREISQLKNENRTLFQTIAAEKEAKESLQVEMEENKNNYSSMNSEALKKLSMLIRDKDLEIESLSERNKSLLEIIENEKGTEKEANEKEIALLEEIKLLKEENFKNKDSVDHSNELKYLKGRIEELESKLNKSSTTENNFNHEPTSSDENLHPDLDSGDRSLVLRLETKSVQLESSEKEVSSLNQEIIELRSLLSTKETEFNHTMDQMTSSQQKIADLEQEVDRVRKSLLSVQSLLDEKTSNNENHQEQSLKYIAECERLSKDLAHVTSEKEAALAQARARTQETQELRKEVSSIIEKKKRVEGEVERLRGHLVQVEEGYTVELMEGEDREKEMRKKVASLEDQLRLATITSTEVTQSASQASSQLTAALESAAGQRDKLSDQLASVQSTLRTRNMELRNLQLALEGFQKQKENELGMVEKTCEERVLKEQNFVAELQEKLRVNKQQLDRAQQGLEAAARLSEQLDKKSSTISNLKQEISVREEMVKSLQTKMLDMSNGQVGKVDRDLVKNLVIGYAIADVSKKPEILKVIATVLDFNGDERSKTGLEGGSGGWLGGLLGVRSRSNSTSQTPIEQNIAKAFIKFLEEESTPKAPVTLPVIEMAKNKTEQLAQAAAQGRSGKTPSPLLTSPSPSLSLPSLSSTANHSPSILKSVLDEPEKEKSENL